SAATASASAASAPRSRRHRMTVHFSRRTWALLAALLLLLASGADWPQFLGPTRNGTSPETGLLQTWPEKGPPAVWEREVGEGNGPRSTPLVAGGKVYTLGADGLLQCLTLEDGKKVWRRELHKDYEVRKGFFGVATSPLVEGNLLVVNVGGRGGAGIVAFDKDGGKEVWKSTDHDASYSSPVAATIDGVRHLLFFTREGVVSLDPASGAARFSKRWRARIDASVNAATPVVVGDHVFVTASYRTGALLLRV